jgi:chaperonin GroEL
LTGTVVYGEQRDFEDFSFDDVGTCDQITITKMKTTFSIENYVDEKRVEEHLTSLQSKLELDSAEEGYSEYEKERLKERIARMTGGVATILVGALTAPELGEKKDRYEDAINAVRAALSNGYVPGAGTALLRTSYNNFSEYTDNLSIAQKTAFNSFMRAIRRPAKMLISSTGEDPEVIIPNLLSSTDNSTIFDARQGKVRSAFEVGGIIDPFSVINNSVIYSSSVAEQFFSLDSVIISDVKNLSYTPLDNVLEESKVEW